MIFISYSSFDSATAQELASYVKSCGFPVFIDYQSLEAGSEFMEAIGREIEKSDVVLLLLSPHATESKWVRWEIGWALRLEKRIVPLLLAPVSYTAVFPLVNLHMLDFRPLNTPEGRALCFEQLDAALSQNAPALSATISHSASSQSDVASGATQAESAVQMSDEQLQEVLVNGLRAATSQPETAVYLARTILQQSPDYLGGWLKEFIAALEAHLRQSRLEALDQRLDEAIKLSDTAVAQLIASDILQLNSSHGKARALLEKIARRKKCNGLYQAAAKVAGADLDVAFFLLKQVRDLEPEYGDPAGLLVNQPITPCSCGLVQQLSRLESDAVHIHARCRYAFNPNARLVVALPFLFEGEWHSDKVAVYRPKESNSLKILTLPGSDKYERFIEILSFSANGAFLATGYGPIVVWDMSTFDPVVTIGRLGKLLALALDPTGEVLAATIARYEPKGSPAPARLFVWKLPSSEPIAVLPQQEQNVREVGFAWSCRDGSVSFSPNQPLVASVWSNCVRVSNYRTGAVTADIAYRDAKAVTFHPDGRRIAVAKSYEVALFDLGDDTSPPRILPLDNKSKQAIACLSFSPSGDILVVGREKQDVELWDPVQLHHLQTLHSDVIDLESVVFSDDSQRLYVKNLVYGLG
jgi:hypothetical protein